MSRERRDVEAQGDESSGTVTAPRARRLPEAHAFLYSGFCFTCGGKQGMMDPREQSPGKLE